jgi:tetratricopeptide (TPR) repeat protein
VLRDAMDLDHITEKALEEFPGGFIDKVQFKTGIKNGMLKQLPMLAEELGAQEYTLLRTYVKDGKHHALFRLHITDGGINYHDYELDEKDGKVVINDLYIYTSGQTISESMANVVAKTIGDGTSSTGITEQATLLNQASDYIGQGEYQQAIQTCERMNSDWKKTKAWNVTYLMAASSLDSTTCESAVEHFQKKFPNDPALPLLMINPYFSREQYDKALDCINKLDNDVKDPALNLLRANAYLSMGKWDDAKRYYMLTMEKTDGDMKTLAGRSLVAQSAIHATNPEDILPTCRELVDKKYASKEDIRGWLGTYPLITSNAAVASWLKS